MVSFSKIPPENVCAHLEKQGLPCSSVTRSEIHFIYLIFGVSNNSTAALVLCFCSYFLDIFESSTRSHPAAVSNEMHFSPGMKIMLSLCDRSCTTSTSARGSNPFGHSEGWWLSDPRGLILPPPPYWPRVLHLHKQVCCAKLWGHKWWRG